MLIALGSGLRGYRNTLGCPTLFGVVSRRRISDLQGDFKTEAKRMEVKVKNVNLIFDVKLFHARNQVGKMVNFLRDIGWDDSRIVDELGERR